ncbi:MAG: transcriptional regulator [Bacteroidetes bacterium]|uniref:response regulator transcription factor n=1 Tax=unclassified Chitinophaga TaxID=2619133 RepID=UPI0009CE414C|nr:MULTISPECIES: response regulator transcription factor [unclassified Chitinophaga]MBP1651374.1 transcriptional regulator [Bacteroidota bacterium]OMP76670.1 DNA-binding response regulator [[Flexibacter] sp. ATCC 35208]WPV63841.1 response regulator transcription factor [Chitinophaga sp. LS1]
MNILIIEDEQALQESITQYLGKQGYICEVATNFREGIQKVNDAEYECIIADIGLPYGSGLDIVKELKQIRSDAGIIIISAKDSLEDKLNGLGLGADDYLTKPFHLSELSARVNALLRRKHFGGNTSIIFHDIQVIPASKTVLVHQKPVDMTAKEYQLLVYFIANQKRVITKSALAAHLWGDEYDMAGSYDFIYSHIKNLRRKLMDAGAPDYIKTVYGTGYRFE